MEHAQLAFKHNLRRVFVVGLLDNGEEVASSRGFHKLLWNLLGTSRSLSNFFLFHQLLSNL